MPQNDNKILLNEKQIIFKYLKKIKSINENIKVANTLIREWLMLPLI